MSHIQKFEDLECWKATRHLVKEIYFLSNEGELAKDFDAKSQIRRAALSAMNNIAEGFSRYSNKEFVRFLDISQSSTAEVKSMLYLLTDLKYVEESRLIKLHNHIDKTRKLIIGLIRYLKTKTSQYKNTIN